MADDYVGLLLVGDVNVHHRRWLRFSRCNTTVGQRLWEICQSHGLVQRVGAPTRKDYLLDLVLSDLNVDTRVLPGITDHDIVEARLPLPRSSAVTVKTKVWLYNQTHWVGLRRTLKNLECESLPSH